MKLVKVTVELLLDENELREFFEAESAKTGVCAKEEGVRCPHSRPRKQRKDIGMPRNEGDMETRFYTPEICELVGCRHSAVNEKVKAFNRLGEGTIAMPGRPYAGGYTATKETWNKFFCLFGK